MPLKQLIIVVVFTYDYTHLWNYLTFFQRLEGSTHWLNSTNLGKCLHRQVQQSDCQASEKEGSCHSSKVCTAYLVQLPKADQIHNCFSFALKEHRNYSCTQRGWWWGSSWNCRTLPIFTRKKASSGGRRLRCNDN